VQTPMLELSQLVHDFDMSMLFWPSILITGIKFRSK